MTTAFSMPAPGEGMAGKSSVSGLLTVAKSWWVAWITRRMEQAAVAYSRSASDGGLEDFRFTHSGIVGAVNGRRQTPVASLAEINRSVDAG